MDGMRTLLGLVAMMALGCQQATAKPPEAAAKPPAAPPRRGVEPRTAALEKEPAHGLMIESFGLVNETFHVTADFDTKALVSVIRLANDSEEKSTRTLTAEELAELLKLRETAWAQWTEKKRSPAAEYQEHLYLLDGQSTTHLRADDGFTDDGPATALARRLKELGKAR